MMLGEYQNLLAVALEHFSCRWGIGDGECGFSVKKIHINGILALSNNRRNAQARRIEAGRLAHSMSVASLTLAC